MTLDEMMNDPRMDDGASAEETLHYLTLLVAHGLLRKEGEEYLFPYEMPDFNARVH